MCEREREREKDRGREEWIVRCGERAEIKDGYFDEGGSFSGLFPLLTVLSGFRGNKPLLPP